MAANFSFVQSAAQTLTTSSTTVTTSSDLVNLTAGNLLIVGVRWEGNVTENDAATAVISDDGPDNTYTLIGYKASSTVSIDHKIGLFYCLSTGTGSNVQFTATIRKAVEKEGLRFLVHDKIPPGDGGTSFGQAVVAGFQRK